MKHFFRNFLAFIILLFLIGGLIIASSTLSKKTQTRSQADTAGIIPPADQRSTVPAGAVLLNGGVGITNGAAMNAGNFQVEKYCSIKSLGAVSQTNTDWFCGNTQLQVSDYDQICQLNYPNSPNAFALFTGNNAVPAFNWRCYAFATVGGSTGGATQPNGATGNACGQPCSAKLGLCAAGSECEYISGPSCSVNSQTYCVPYPPAAGWSRPNCVARDTGNQYSLDPSGQSPTVAEIQQACASAAAPVAPQPVPAQAFSVSDLNHNGKADPDDYRLFLQDYRAHLGQ